jgi:hypothetical protein
MAVTRSPALIRAIFMITFLADRSIRPRADDFYAMAVAFSAGASGGAIRIRSFVAAIAE